MIEILRRVRRRGRALVYRAGKTLYLFNDYGFSGTRGSRLAVEECFADKPEVPLVLPTGQAILFRLGHGDDQ